MTNHAIPEIGEELTACLYRDVLFDPAAVRGSKNLTRDNHKNDKDEDDDNNGEEVDDDDDDDHIVPSQNHQRYWTVEDRETIRNLIAEFGTAEARKYIRNVVRGSRRGYDNGASVIFGGDGIDYNLVRDSENDDENDDDDDEGFEHPLERQKMLDAAKKKVADILGIEIQEGATGLI